uniref:Coiled-coil domain containing 157 n=1 Tax=Leptobrachium leishanense TaxID=445787 RepID=A0A8C5N1A3_9ANUR
MMHMLGDRMCMESLRKDITDLQGTLVDVFSRVGAVRYPSWKFPDKISCDLDLVQLLETYDFVEDEPDFTQLSHVVLLELVIDRLLLLIQSFTTYTCLTSNDKGHPPTHDQGSSMSVGLAVRKFWSNMLKLGTDFKQSKADQKSCLAKGETGNETSQRLSSSRLQSTPARSQRRTVTPSSQNYIAWDTRTVGCQTMESALVPCDACSIAQNSLREVSDAIINVCIDQNLPCSLSKLQERLNPMGIMSSNEMCYWASEESKDLARISKHLSELKLVILPLQDQLQAASVENHKMQLNIESEKKKLEAQQEDMKRQIKENERHLQQKEHQSVEAMNKMERDKEELRKGAAVLGERVSILKEELKSQHGIIRDLELTKDHLMHEMQSMVTKEKVTVLEQKVSELKNHLDTTLQLLHDSEEIVSKEQAHVESLQNHKESLQMKQKSLIQELDRLSQECENLQGSLSDSEEEKAKLGEQMEELETEKNNLRSQLEEKQKIMTQLQQEKQSLKDSISGMKRQLKELEVALQEQRENARLLVSYPDLHAPPVIESTGDITEDMDKQLQANSIRINILEEENSKLRTSLSKLREKDQLGQLRLIPQTQLWNTQKSPEPISMGYQQSQSNARSSTSQSSSVAIARDPPNATSTVSGEHMRRGSSGNAHQALNFLTFPSEMSPIAAYARVKQVKGRSRTSSSDRK